MHFLPYDERHLQSALDLARHAAGMTSPNPTVGCIVANGDVVLGEGAHLYDHFDHAEIVALKRAASLNHDVRGATAYVTLEPCAHHGRTGPCSEALIAAGISHCVVATVDPNPLVRGKGVGKMQAAGIDVVIVDPTSPLAQQARMLNDAFAFSIQHGRPFVTLKAAVSLDGYLAPPPSSRSTTAPHWITGEAARKDAQHLRHAADAIVTGIGTVLADDPSLTDRTGLPRRRPLLRVILDSRLRIPQETKLLSSMDHDVLIVAAEDTPEDRISSLQECGAEVLLAPSLEDNGRIDLLRLLTALQERGIRHVLVEAGAAINGSFLAAGLVDQAVLYISEQELGEGSVPFAAGYPSPYQLQNRLTSVERTAFPHAPESTLEDIRIAGYIHDPWSGI